VYAAGCLAALKVGKRVCVGVFVSVVDHPSGDSVAEHFLDVFQRHLDRGHFPRHRVVICPIFKVVLVSALVVHPGVGKAVILPLALVGGTVALIVPGSDYEFRRGILREVVEEPLKKDPCLAAVPDNGVPVFCNGLEMLPGFYHKDISLTA